jgi:adenine-specific DNA-methyltransferase
MTDRRRAFQQIEGAVQSHLRSSSDGALVVEGDSLELLRKMPAHTVSLILTDPPYHATKKENIYGDTAFEQDEHYLDWLKEYAAEWHRVLKSNGSLYCFATPSMAARLEVMLSTQFNILSHITWTKPNEPGYDGWKGKMNKGALRQWYPHSERIIFAEPACEGNLHRSPFADFLRKAREQTGLSAKDLAEITGAYGRVNHGGAVSNWETGRNIPSREQYAKMCDALIATGRIKEMPPYEDAIRRFSMDSKREFTDIWTFENVRPYRGKHPAEKPIELLEHAIEATTYEGDIVLDCFAGSGNTALAALRLRRRAVAMEIDPAWVTNIVARLGLGDHADGRGLNGHLAHTRRPAKRQDGKLPQLHLPIG